MASVAYVWIIVLGIFTCLSTSSKEAKKLYYDIIHGRDYNKLIRPSGEGSGKLTVNMGMRLSQLLDVDEKNQIMTTNVWLRHEWHDLRLVWNPEEYGDVERLHIPSKELWRPDIVLYNNADGDFVISLLTKATVYHTGKIVWEPPAIYKSFCPIDVEFFPFDMQECFMKFGSWTYDGSEVDLHHLCQKSGTTIEEGAYIISRGVDIKDFYPNVEWDIINVTAKRKQKFYPCCPDVLYPDIHFNITLRRRTLFYSLNLIMPCVSISLLTVLVFYLPSDSGEKITLSISILLALTVFFLLLSDINPPTSLVIPLIVKYLLFTMIVVTMSIFLTVYTLSIHYRTPTTHKMSPWTRKLFTEILPRILIMRRPIPAKSSKVAVRTCNGIEMRETYCASDLPTYENVMQHSDEGEPSSSNHHPEVQKALQCVRFIADHLSEEHAELMEILDWKYIAMVMDRLFLYIFAFACFGGTMSIFLYAPSLYDSRPRLSLDGSEDCQY